MKSIKANYTIITPINGEEILKQIELAARTCYQSEGKIEYEPFDHALTFIAKSARVLIPKLIARGHEAMLEFGGMITVRFINDRGVSHEQVRHRLSSFAQESTRYCNYEGKDMEFIDIKPHLVNPNVSLGIWFNHMIASEIAYNEMLAAGESPQIARSVLPNSLKTEINIGANIREWRHIFKQRTAKAAHPQMRELMCPLLDEFKKLIPILFDDINY